MPLGSSSAAPVIKPGPSCFSRGNRAAGFPAAAEAAARFSSFAVISAVLGVPRGAAAVYGENPDRSDPFGAFHAMLRTVMLTMGLQKSRPDFFQKSGEPAIAHCIRGLGYSS